MRRLPRSDTKTRAGEPPTAIPCGVLNWPGPVPRVPHFINGLPLLSNFTTRVFPYPSATKNVPSGSQSIIVGRRRRVRSSLSPNSSSTPIVCTSCLPSCVNLKITWRMSSTTQTCRSGSYGLM